jgi:hypothetical protein
LVGTQWWITSNLHPRDWYPECDESTRLALERRLNIINITYPRTLSQQPSAEGVPPPGAQELGLGPSIHGNKR